MPSKEQAFEQSLKGLHPKLQETIRNRLIQTQPEPDTEAMRRYRGILEIDAWLDKEEQEGWFWKWESR